MLSILGKVFNRILLNRMKDALIRFSVANKQAFERTERPKIRLQPYASFWNNPWSGIRRCMSTSLTMKRLLTACTGSLSRGFCDTMECQERLPRSSRSRMKEWLAESFMADSSRMSLK
ncbi:hypothetical protein DPMN_058992 [Dreissena polymorpha]|uniref:Uncharacterized protein n=1 Tax=Dreissena polymorpha TaxID=45954 RepID=A0A9D4C2R5_DREPO|nr:hypothetical protein DPMN_058992 [Dreissena polymorpha]